MTPAKRRVSASNMVLFLLCLMYFVTYLDRVNIATAGGEIMKDLGMSNTQFGLILSAFAYPYAIFQVIGGSVGDKFGARRTLLVCGLIWASATILTGMVGGLISLFLARVLLGFGEGATFPTATRAMQNWTAPGKRGFAQGITHAFARLGNAVAPPIVAFLIYQFGWRLGFVILGVASFAWVVVWFWYFRERSERTPGDHPGGTRGPATSEQGRRQAERALGPPHSAHVAGDADLFLLRLDPVAVPRLAPELLQAQLRARSEELGPVCVGRVLRRCRRRHPGRRVQRPHPEAHRRSKARPAQRHRGRLPRRGGEPHRRVLHQGPDTCGVAAQLPASSSQNW